MPNNAGPTNSQYEHLEKATMVGLNVGRVLLESGAKARVVSQGATMVAKGLGAEDVSIRSGFASLAMTVRHGPKTITRMMGVGPHGVNMRLNFSVRRLCSRVNRGGMSADEAEKQLAALSATTPRHNWLLVCVAVGFACSAFGRLLGIDWIAYWPVWIGAAIGQGLRHQLVQRGVNGFVVAAIVAFTAAFASGSGALFLNSATVETAMFSAVLLLVPGVPAVNAQTDIMEGRPTLGSARAIHVFMILVFVTVGIWFAQAALELTGTNMPTVQRNILHQTLFGAIASAGFAVLFNFGWKTVFWAAVGGATALAVRTLGYDAGWSLAASSFAAAAAAAAVVRVIGIPPIKAEEAGVALAITGCIPMVPGSAAEHTIMGLLALTAQTPSDGYATLLVTVESGLSTVFTIGAIGAGLTIVTALLKHRDFPS